MREDTINEKDWKLFKKRLPEWTDRFYQQENSRVLHLLLSNLPEKDKFWQLEKMIRAARNNPVTDLRVSRSGMLEAMTFLFDEGMIHQEDLEGFTLELAEYLQLVHRINARN